MKKITKKQFLADVRHEIEMLKTHTTDAEKSKLNIKDLVPRYRYSCIYGLISGDCNSKRAFELIDLCCIRIVNNNESNILRDFNGYDKTVFQKGRRFFDHLSILEAYMMIYEAKNENILAYIKGETSKLTV
jgi:hypothetical protein